MSEVTTSVRITTVISGPVRRSDRIDSLDVMRGVALLGILLMNIIAFGLPFATYYNPSVAGIDNPANLWAYIVNWLFFEGTMRALFSMLFGAGMVLMTTRAEERGAGIEAADVYYRRLLWLILFGVIDAYLLLWVGDILFLYGIAGLFLFVFRGLAPRTLFLIGVAMLVVLGIKNVNASNELAELRQVTAEVESIRAAGGEPSREQLAAIDHLEEIRAEFEPDPEQIQEQVEARHSGYIDQVKYLVPLNIAAQSTLTYTLGIWDVLMMMFMGMALIKWGVCGRLRDRPAHQLVRSPHGHRVRLRHRVVGDSVRLHLSDRPGGDRRRAHRSDHDDLQVRPVRLHHEAPGRRRAHGADQLSGTQRDLHVSVHRGRPGMVRRARALRALLRGGRDLAVPAHRQPDLAEVLPLRPHGVALAVADLRADPAHAPLTPRVRRPLPGLRAAAPSTLPAGYSSSLPANAPISSWAVCGVTWA
jgi:uncharacterized membrane protein YeiB